MYVIIPRPDAEIAPCHALDDDSQSIATRPRATIDDLLHDGCDRHLDPGDCYAGVIVVYFRSRACAIGDVVGVCRERDGVVLILAPDVCGRVVGRGRICVHRQCCRVDERVSWHRHVLPTQPKPEVFVGSKVDFVNYASAAGVFFCIVG